MWSRASLVFLQHSQGRQLWHKVKSACERSFDTIEIQVTVISAIDEKEKSSMGSARREEMKPYTQFCTLTGSRARWASRISWAAALSGYSIRGLCYHRLKSSCWGQANGLGHHHAISFLFFFWKKRKTRSLFSKRRSCTRTLVQWASRRHLNILYSKSSWTTATKKHVYTYKSVAEQLTGMSSQSSCQILQRAGCWDRCPSGSCDSVGSTSALVFRPFSPSQPLRCYIEAYGALKKQRHDTSNRYMFSPLTESWVCSKHWG